MLASDDLLGLLLFGLLFLHFFLLFILFGLLLFLLLSHTEDRYLIPQSEYKTFVHQIMGRITD